MKCDNCGEETNCLEEIWVYMEKRWGKEEIKKRVCPDCHELIIQETFYEKKHPVIEATFSKEDKEWICSNCCNLKECVEECPFHGEDEEYDLDSEDMEYICSHCRLVDKECDEQCPVREAQKQS